MNELDLRIKKLYNNWIYFNFDVIEFEVIFSDNKEISELRQDTVPDFFMNLKDLYFEKFLMIIARLLDNDEQGKNNNLTLFTLPQILKENNKNEWTDLYDKVKNLKEYYSDIILYRRKHLGHYDLEYTLGTKEFNTSTHINEVHLFLDKSLSLINETLKILDSEQQNGLVIPEGRYKGARELIRLLKLGNQSDNLELD
jgi:hypothetical protein